MNIAVQLVGLEQLPPKMHGVSVIRRWLDTGKLHEPQILQCWHENESVGFITVEISDNRKKCWCFLTVDVAVQVECLKKALETWIVASPDSLLPEVTFAYVIETEFSDLLRVMSQENFGCVSGGTGRSFKDGIEEWAFITPVFRRRLPPPTPRKWWHRLFAGVE